jgi:hypothetical protein
VPLSQILLLVIGFLSGGLLGLVGAYLATRRTKK